MEKVHVANIKGFRLVDQTDNEGKKTKTVAEFNIQILTPYSEQGIWLNKARLTKTTTVDKDTQEEGVLTSVYSTQVFTADPKRGKEFTRGNGEKYKGHFDHSWNLSDTYLRGAIVAQAIKLYEKSLRDIEEIGAAPTFQMVPVMQEPQQSFTMESSTIEDEVDSLLSE